MNINSLFLTYEFIRSFLGGDRRLTIKKKIIIKEIREKLFI